MTERVTLTKEQLRTVKEFIHSRGFHDPVTVVELLDHFACMIEERMEQDSSLTLEDAMYDAHRSFGAMGFRYIAANLEKGYRLKYKKTYRHTFKEMLTSPLTLLPVLLCLLGTYYLYINYRHVEMWVFSAIDLLFVVYLLLLLVGTVRGYRFYKRNFKSKHRFYTGAFRGSSVIMFVLPQIVFIHTGPNPPEHLLYVAAIAFALFATWCFLELFVFFKTMKELMLYYKRPFELFTELTD